ncbi:MAG: hypothetical protein ACK498_14225 [Cyclobacteriaceae bacterium]|jgi:hypothetical protein
MEKIAHVFCRGVYPIRVTLAVLSFFVLIGNAQAQDQGEIEKVEIQIVKDKQIVLPRVDRNFEKVPPRPSEPIKPEITYSFKKVDFTTPDYSPSIRPLKLKTEPIRKLYGNYVRVGYGNYASPLIEGSLSSKRDRNKYYGLKVSHHSFGSGPVDGESSSSGSTAVKVFGNTFGKSFSSGAFVSFENWNNKFYGTLPGVFKGDASAQSYTVYSVGASVSNLTSSDFEYKLVGGLSYLTDRLSSSENEINLNLTSAYKLKKSNRINLNADYFLMARTFEPQGTRSRHLLKIRPSYQFSPIENLTLTVGVNTAFQNDTLGNVKSVNLYPNLLANYELSRSIQIYAGLTGDMDKVSLHSLSRENSWIRQNVLLNHTNRTVEFLGGLKGELGGKVAFHTGFGAANLKNLYFYQNDITKAQQFAVVVDQGNTQRVNLFAELGYSAAEKVRASVRGDYFGYSTDKIKEAWHRPTYRIGFQASYNLYNKILLDADFILQGGMKALSIDDPIIETYKAITISEATDLNLKVSYLVSDQFSFFIKANNILDNQYQVYLYYPVRGFQALAGLTWSF